MPQNDADMLSLKHFKKPDSLSEIIALFMYMYKNKLYQAKLAEELGIGKPKFSQIMNGKRKPDIYFLKAIYNKLKIDLSLF